MMILYCYTSHLIKIITGSKFIENFLKRFSPP